MLRLGVFSLGVIFVAVAMFAVISVRTPGEKERLSAVLGPVEIVESGSGRAGFDRHYWAVVSCDPAAVRTRLAALPEETLASKSEPPSQKMRSLGFDIPVDLSGYDQDWIWWCPTPGAFRMIAYPNDGSDRLFFLEMDI